MEHKPKKPLNAYLLYSESVREEIKKENPDIKQNELIKIIAQRYKNESKEVLQKFKDLAKQKQEEFKESNPEYSYDKSSTKKKKQVGQNFVDPVQNINEQFISHPFTLQCISGNSN